MIAPRFSALQKRCTSPISDVRTLVAHGLGLAISPRISTSAPTISFVIVGVMVASAGPDMSMNKAAHMYCP